MDVAEILLGADELDFLPRCDLARSTLREFRSHSAARMSVADAAIVAAAQRHGVEYVATFDESFRGISGISMVPAWTLRPARHPARSNCVRPSNGPCFGKRVHDPAQERHKQAA